MKNRNNSSAADVQPVCINGEFICVIGKDFQKTITMYNIVLTVPDVFSLYELFKRIVNVYSDKYWSHHVHTQ